MNLIRRLMVLLLLAALGGCANFATVDPQVAGIVVCKPGSAISYRMPAADAERFPEYMHGSRGTCR